MSRLRKLDEEIMKNNIDAKIALLEQNVSHMNETLARMEKKIDSRFDDADKRIEKLDSKIEKTNDRIWSTFIWQLSAMLGLAGIMAKGFHWL